MNNSLRVLALGLPLVLIPLIATAQTRSAGKSPKTAPAASSSASTAASSAPSETAAETPAEAPATPAAPAAAPDVVLLKNGAMLRGTIIEKDPEGSVTIQLPTGKTRTIAMSEVTYAGPESDRPKRAAPKTSTPPPPRSERRQSMDSERSDRSVRPFVTVHSGEATIRFRADAPRTTLHLKTGSAVAEARGITAVATGYEVVCTAPCTATLPAGTHQFAVSQGGSKPVPADDMTSISGDSVMKGEYSSMAGLRAAGWVVFAGGFLGGLLLMTTSKESCETVSYSKEQSCTPEHPYVKEGVALGLLGMAIGFPLTFIKDSASVTVSAGSSDWSRQRREGTSTARSLMPDGVALTGRF